MKASLKMSNQEFGHVPAFMEKTARLLGLRIFAQVSLSGFSAHSTFPIKKFKEDGRVSGCMAKQGLVTAFLFAPHKH